MALFLELLLIRWAPSVVRLVAYYANLLLISSFLGWGALASPRGRNLFGWFPWLLAGNVGFLLLCRSATLPGSGAEMRFFAGGGRILDYGVLVGIFAANAVLFFPLGGQIGRLFGQLPATHAYAWDLLGSLCGTVTFALFSFVHFDPLVGLAAVALLALALADGWGRLGGIPAYAIALAAVAWASPPGAIWSPYYFITIQDPAKPGEVPTPPHDVLTRIDPPFYLVSVNQVFYQMHGTIDPARYTPGSPRALRVKDLSDQYFLPYALSTGRERIAVLGSGGGMDVEAALLSGARHVDAVDIDPRLIELARRHNASGVYNDPRVSVRIDDARAFLRRARPGYYDMVVFGFLDSQALFSSLSNLRLDSFTYTIQALRAADRLLEPDGTLCLSFAAGQPWLARKLVGMVEEATGRTPLVYTSGAQVVICAPKRPPATPPPARFGRFAQAQIDSASAGTVPLATDDWPFLYLSARTIPADYLVVIGSILLVTLLGLNWRPPRSPWPPGDWHAFFLGLSFLLLETKSIGDCSLYFGATWLVTTIVVAGILLMVLLANMLGAKARPSLLWYAPLFATLLAVTLVPHHWVLGLDFGARLLWALIAVPAPIFFAGIIFTAGLRQAPEVGSFFGANLVGAMVGGFCEYLGMATGNAALMVLVFAAYFASAFCRRPRALAVNSPNAGPGL